jgi:hypothetical protein
MSSHETNTIIKAGRIREVLRHLRSPSILVSVLAILESISEDRGINALGFAFPLEQWTDFPERESQVIDKPKKVIQITTVDTLDNATQLLGSDLGDRVHRKGHRLRQIVPDRKHAHLRDFIDVLVCSDVELRLARLGRLQGADKADCWLDRGSEFEIGNPTWSRAAARTSVTDSTATVTDPSSTVKSRSAE